MNVLVTQSCPTFCNPTDCSPPGSPVLGILQAGILEWMPFPSPEDLPNPRTEPRPLAMQANSLPFEPPGVALKEKNARCCSQGNKVGATLRSVKQNPCDTVKLGK